METIIFIWACPCRVLISVVETRRAASRLYQYRWGWAVRYTPRSHPYPVRCSLACHPTKICHVLKLFF